jgi:hypothetical protein
MKSIAIAACWQQNQRPETVCVSGLWFHRQELLMKYIRSFEHDFRLFAGVDDDFLDESAYSTPSVPPIHSNDTTYSHNDTVSTQLDTAHRAAPPAGGAAGFSSELFRPFYTS